ncbi:hypothetical protein PsorP6_000891 [Peronosclerospora sorghi]|uniref:Uncharacterized protein n=1 Tax=Peronosclerospora sorghi TaxID=230839 RepID=A0ACC0WVG7_9STRA|nr:hypothetical protein PsorP6_000891 [Peronosclerospora sorghi]
MYECVYASVTKPCVRYSNCNMVRVSDVETFTNALWGSLRSFELSPYRGISSFTDSLSLPYLQVIILDKTIINDDGLRAIAHVAPSLKYFPLQECLMIYYDGLAAIASLGYPEGCTDFELVDLMYRAARGSDGTPITYASIQTLETRCPKLRLVRVDSYRSVSRKIRQKYYERVLRMGSGDPVCKLELLFSEKKRREMVKQKTIDSDSDEKCEDYQDEADYAM